MPQEAETCCPLRHEAHQHVNMQGTKKEELLGVCSMSINEKSAFYQQNRKVEGAAVII
jgi:hypothetical protein